jgi:hypothetical protein
LLGEGFKGEVRKLFMNKAIYILLIILLTISCSKKEEEKFEAFSPEAFAYDIGDSWEVNATVNVKGFARKEVGDELSASLDYSVDLTGPDSIDVESIFVDSKDVTDSELIDVQLEAQFELDYNSPEGLYQITFNVTDNNSGEKTSAQTQFELKK